MTDFTVYHAEAAYPTMKDYQEHLLSESSFESDVRREDQARKRSQTMIVLCFACSFVFLLLFFLIPRTPLVSGVSSMQGHITTDSSPSFVIEAGYDMFNPNPYAVAVSKIDTTVTVSTTPSTIEQIYTISGAGVWPPGQSSVNIRSSSWGTVPVWYYFNGTDSLETHSYP